MHETRTETVQAGVLAVGLHLLLAGALFVGLRQASERLPQAAGEAIQADTVDAGTLSAETQALLRAPMQSVPPPVAAPPTPLPEPLPEPEPVPEPAAQARPEPTPPAPRPVEPQRSVPKVAPPEPAVPAPAPKPEPSRNPPTPRPAAATARPSPLPRSPVAQAAPAPTSEAARRADLEAQRRQQQADAQNAGRRSTGAAQAPGPAGARGVDRSLQARWTAAMLDAIERQWIRPESVTPAMRCPIRILMAAGGRVISAEVQPGCAYDAAARLSVEMAVRKASPLPYAGFESVASNDFIVNFQASP